MTDDPEQLLWRIEEDFWLGDAAMFRSQMDGDAIMVLPAPAGILRGEAIIDSLARAPRWRTVKFTERSVKRTGNVAVLAYHASAERADTPIYEALCGSTYLNDNGEWRLMTHQQTPC